MLSSLGGPYLSATSWPALSWFASVHSIVAGRGVNGLGSFCRNKRTSPAVAKPGNTENHVDMLIRCLGIQVRWNQLLALFFWQTPDGF
ncbi:MAG TPA: hypothetical protein DD706_10475 [Nitrospiraceae bacterium]|nr:hypothetical protein [Nitrospiraceae bacterium]